MIDGKSRNGQQPLAFALYVARITSTSPSYIVYSTLQHLE